MSKLYDFFNGFKTIIEPLYTDNIIFLFII